MDLLVMLTFRKSELQLGLICERFKTMDMYKLFIFFRKFGFNSQHRAINILIILAWIHFAAHAATGLVSKMPPVPRRDERPVRNGPSGRDFVTENALAAMMAEPRYKKKEEVNWLQSETFGRVPAYLDRIKKERESERDYILNLLDQQQMEAEAASGSHTREMTDEERHELIDALKRKWDVVNSKYQVISHRKISTSNSTMGELRWKESCESQMAQLEADIKKLSVKAPLYVVE